MYLVADILLVLFLGLLVYRGIKYGFLTSTLGILSFIPFLLNIVLALGCAFAVSYFVFPLFGWIEDFKVGLIDFGNSFSGILKLLNVTSVTPEDIAEYTAIGISTLVLSVPFYIFWKWIHSLFQRLVKWVREKSGFFRVLGSVLGAVCNLAFGAVVVLGVFWAFASVDGSGAFTYTNEVLRSGYLTSLIYEYNPLYAFLGDPGCYAVDFGNIIQGNF